jgi:hypothetical protein
MIRLISRIVGALFLMVLVLGGVRSRPVQAATSQLLVAQRCSANGVSVNFSWQGNDPTALQQWVDLSLFDNNWQPSTFINAGPFAASATSFQWDGLLPNATHFVRVNQQRSDGTWDPSPTFQVITENCVFASIPATSVPTGTAGVQTVLPPTGITAIPSASLNPFSGMASFSGMTMTGGIAPMFGFMSTGGMMPLGGMTPGMMMPMGGLLQMGMQAR